MAEDEIPTEPIDPNDPTTPSVDPDDQLTPPDGAAHRLGVPPWALVAAAAIVLGVTGYLVWPRSPAVQRGEPHVVAVSSADELRIKAEKGDATAQLDLGDNYGAGNGVPRDPAEALKWYRKAAEQGLAKAQVKLGWVYIGGLGTAKDPVEGANWFRKAAQQGSADAQY